MRKYKFFVMAIGLLFASNVEAQSVSSLDRDIKNLREDFEVMQRKIYNGAVSNVTSDNTVKIGEIEEDVRSINGRIDGLEHKIRKLNERIDIINRDVDMRISMIEGKPVTGTGTAAPKAPQFEAPVATNAPKSITGDSINSGNDLKPIENEELKAVYEKGLADLRANNYDAAEASFNEVLTKYPKDRLAGNAQYWLGEVHYGKKEYDKAAVAFAKGYQNYKDGSKGPDSLLKLGMSMKALKKNPEACAAFTSMDIEFPKAEASIKTKAKEEAKNLSCK